MVAPTPFGDEMGDPRFEDDESDLWLFILFMMTLVIGLGVWVWFFPIF